MFTIIIAKVISCEHSVRFIIGVLNSKLIISFWQPEQQSVLRKWKVHRYSLRTTSNLFFQPIEWSFIIKFICFTTKIIMRFNSEEWMLVYFDNLFPLDILYNDKTMFDYVYWAFIVNLNCVFVLSFYNLMALEMLLF